MRVGDGKPQGIMEQASRGWQERFTKNHRRNGRSSNKAASIIERLGTPTYPAGKKALIIPRFFTVGIQPLSEVSENIGDFVRHRQRTRHGGQAADRGRRTAVRDHFTKPANLN